jgi:F-type H+-transporting ATPase subunit delta
MPRPDTAARRYAEAAFDIAQRDGTIETWRADLDTVAAALEDEAAMRALANPAAPLEARNRLVESTLGGRVSRPVINLVLLLLQRGRIEAIGRVAAEFRRLDNQRQGIVTATATSAAELTPDEVRALTARLEQRTGGRIELTTAIDPAILGGIIVRLGDRLIDGSVRGRLERLRTRLVSGAL